MTLAASGIVPSIRFLRSLSSAFSISYVTESMNGMRRQLTDKKALRCGNIGFIFGLKDCREPLGGSMVSSRS
jgi:hypothetical protein